ncbi:DUF6074 family protein [Hoeflea sp. CAU 1731]
MTMKTDQLDLFNPGHSAQIIPFPSDRLIGKARHVADVIISKKSVSAANSYWQTSVLKHFIARLEALGFNKLRIDNEVRSFHDAVCRELARRGWFNPGKEQNGPHDAA